MAYKPDYGLRLLNNGISRNVDHYFHEFRLYRLDVLCPDQYTTMVEIPFDDEVYTLSLDFNEQQLMQILSQAPQDIAAFIIKELSRDPYTPRTINFDGEIAFGVRARLGAIQITQIGTKEVFVPFIAQEII
jgi:hypothetical protein